MTQHPSQEGAQAARADQAYSLDRAATHFGNLRRPELIDHFPFRPQSGDYLAFLGRIAPEKRPDWVVGSGGPSGDATLDPADHHAYERVDIKLLNKHPKMTIARELGANAGYHRAS